MPEGAHDGEPASLRGIVDGMSVPSRLSRLPARSAGPFSIFLADTPWARLAGLAGLRDIPPGTALLLRSARSVHTAGMRFALDLVWLDGRGGVVRVDHEVPPGRVRTCLAARAVVECRAAEGSALMSTLEDGCRP